MAQSERREPCETDTQHLINLSGYLWARKVIGPAASGWLLDVASGTGYGADLLSETAERIVACDDDLEALAASRKNYPRENLVFLQCRGERLPFRSGSFDAVVSLETVEHVSDDKGFVSEIHRVLKPGGFLALTTPVQKDHCDHPKNPHHIREYSAESLAAVIEPFFDVHLLLGRRPGEAMAASEARMDRIRRFDFLSLRNVVPRFLRHRIADVWLRVFGDATLVSLRPDDVLYSPDLAGAGSMAVLARRRP